MSQKSDEIAAKLKTSSVALVLEGAVVDLRREVVVLSLMHADVQRWMVQRA